MQGEPPLLAWGAPTPPHPSPYWSNMLWYSSHVHSKTKSRERARNLERTAGLAESRIVPLPAWLLYGCRREACCGLISKGTHCLQHSHPHKGCVFTHCWKENGTGLCSTFSLWTGLGGSPAVGAQSKPNASSSSAESGWIWHCESQWQNESVQRRRLFLVWMCQPPLCAAGTGRASPTEWGHTRALHPTLCFPCWHYESSVNIHTACSREGHTGSAKHRSASWQHCQGIFQTLSKLLKILWKWKMNIYCNAKDSQRRTRSGGGGEIWLVRRCRFGKTLVMPLTLAETLWTTKL